MKRLRLLSIVTLCMTLGAFAAERPQGLRSDLKVYVIQPGDSLWSIAAKPAVLGDAFLWPLLYDQNHVLIPDPGRLEPGQSLAFLPSYGPFREFRARKRAKRYGGPRQ